MDFFEYVDRAERNIEIVNPSSLDKIIKLGEVLDLNASSRIIDFGCGYAEMLIQWATKFGISGVGIDIRDQACKRAKEKIAEKGLNKRIEIVCGKGADYRFKEHEFDVASCIGSTFIWEGFRSAIKAMKPAIKPGGSLVIGEVYWQQSDIPKELVERMPSVTTESEMLKIARQEGFDFEFIIRASDDDWDNYETSNWVGARKWINENPEHPQRQDMIDMLRREQDSYIDFTRKYIGWAMYVLTPAV